MAKGITVSGIEEFMKMSRELPLGHDSTVTIKGIFSEFPAILNLSLLFPISAPIRAGYDFTKYIKLPAIPGPNFALPIRLKPVKGLGLASLHGNKSVSVYDNCLPLFSEVNSVHSLKNITGKKVRIIGQPISLDDRWGNLFVSDKITSFQKGSTQKYVGLLIKDIHVLEDEKYFFIDLWRMDHFQMIDIDEECLEFYLIKPPSDWPHASNNMINYLSIAQMEGFRKKLVPWFAVVAKVDTPNRLKLKNARDLLHDYYIRTFQRSVLGRTLIPINGIGHGICNPSILKRSDCIFQYDQINPLLKQNYKIVIT